jgi:hypothetical protein
VQGLEMNSLKSIQLFSRAQLTHTTVYIESTVIDFYSTPEAAAMLVYSWATLHAGSSQYQQQTADVYQ